MPRNRLILACAAILLFGTWIAWRSISRVDAEAPMGDVAISSSSTEKAPSIAPSLDRAAPEVESSRAPASVEPKVDTRPPVLVAGIVVDDHDTPLEAASVYVGHEGEVSLSSHGPSRLFQSDASGRFEVRGSEESTHAYVSASKPGYFAAQVTLERGATNVKLVLRPGGVVAGRILVDRGIPMDLLRVRLELPDVTRYDKPIRRGVRRSIGLGDPLSDPWVYVPLDDGQFTFEGLLATPAKIAVMVQDQVVPVAEVDSIRVRDAGEAVDPRLDPLDLRGILQLLSIDVLDDASRKCSGATVVLSDPIGRFGDRGRATQDGRATFLAPKGVYDVDVDLAGWRRAHLSGVLGSQTVQLKKGSPVRVILDGSGALPASPYRLVVALLVDVPQPRSVVDGMGAFAGGRETTLLASSPGLHEVAWYLENGSRQTFLTGTPRKIVELRDSDVEQSVHIDLADAVRESWERTIRYVESEAERLTKKDEELK
jgi:hypothetical protein